MKKVKLGERKYISSNEFFIDFDEILKSGDHFLMNDSKE